MAGKKGMGDKAARARESLADAKEILKRIRQHYRLGIEGYLRELDTIIRQGSSEAVKLNAIRFLTEYATGGPPTYATATDSLDGAVPDTDEYRAFREYELSRFRDWQATQSRQVHVDSQDSAPAIEVQGLVRTD